MRHDPLFDPPSMFRMSCTVIALVLLGNMIFWGGLFWFTLFLLRQYGVI